MGGAAEVSGVLAIERIGGPGFGGPHLKSRGQVSVASLSPADRKAVDALFASGGKAANPKAPGQFRYRITRAGSKGPQTIEAPESAMPAALIAAVRDTLE